MKEKLNPSSPDNYEKTMKNFREVKIGNFIDGNTQKLTIPRGKINSE
jgi:hypothetical protein